ncbi:protein aurora borealis [Drosophila grimshawi]|uniref:Protein aurora borealis n=1 Tax=Drosophila grimshawi TaxID=7222 RepID=B4IWU2_DROGR|nr:protein aurora borealis [Drosophila grimshawi]EDV97343.1 GH16808 [Drosophila grimshawi]
MYTDEVRTPHALKTRYYASLNEIKCRVTTSGRRSLSNNNNSNHFSATASTTGKNGAKEASKMQLKSSPQMCTSTTVCTPPPKRLQKVRNPFEGALTERLHLPLIASPSLFQCRSRTPQLSSTQFEWDIEEVSQLKPADVEPHETQFHDSPDAEQESKAQLAISAFFKESHIVPSPVDCPLRKQRIILNEIAQNDNTPISNRSKPRSRDSEVQTELSLPPVLPKALEEALRPYLQSHLAGSSRRLKSGSGLDLFNSSMRRKLFDLKNVIVLGEMEQERQQSTEDEDQHLQMVGSSPQAKQTIFAGRLSDSPREGSNSFGCLSPIRNLCGLHPGTPDDGNGPCSARKRKQLLHELVDLPSPIAPSEHLSRRFQRIASNNQSSSSVEHVTLSELTGTGRVACKFTPDRSSSPMALEYSTDSSINQRVSRLRVNSARQLPVKSLIEQDEMPDYETDQEEVEEEDADGMQLSQLSTHSFNCSSSNSDTPRGHRRHRSANRKNLSQSFSANLLDESDKQEEEQQQQAPQADLDKEPEQAAPRIGLYRTDSGFNETHTNTSNFAFSQELPTSTNYDCNSMDVSMVCCSTPSTRS